jgi:beta-phosphoglucomutase-like phosphatase (HAD superfamily)
VHRAAARLGVAPDRCAVVGDIATDMEAARAAGALAILVPNEQTRHDELAAGDITVSDLAAAVDGLLRARDTIRELPAHAALDAGAVRA